MCTAAGSKKRRGRNLPRNLLQLPKLEPIRAHTKQEMAKRKSERQSKEDSKCAGNQGLMTNLMWEVEEDREVGDPRRFSVLRSRVLRRVLTKFIRLEAKAARP